MITGMSATKIFANNADSMRERLGWTKMKLAELAGIPGPRMSCILKGDNSINVRTAEAIAKALGVPIANLFSTQFVPDPFLVNDHQKAG